MKERPSNKLTQLRQMVNLHTDQNRNNMLVEKISIHNLFNMHLLKAETKSLPQRLTEPK